MINIEDSNESGIIEVEYNFSESNSTTEDENDDPNESGSTTEDENDGLLYWNQKVNNLFPKLT
jgi:hypothetical protein